MIFKCKRYFYFQNQKILFVLDYHGVIDLFPENMKICASRRGKFASTKKHHLVLLHFSLSFVALLFVKNTILILYLIFEG